MPAKEQQKSSSPDAYLTSEYFQVSKQLVPLYVGFTVLGLGICFGYNCGYAVNPARDLAPRLFTALAGWGPDVFTAYSHWWVVPVLSCHAGGVAGAWLYYLAIELHWVEEDKEQDRKGRKVEDIPDYSDHHNHTNHSTSLHLVCINMVMGLLMRRN